MLEQVLEEEMTEHLCAGHRERTSTRRGQTAYSGKLFQYLSHAEY